MLDKLILDEGKPLPLGATVTEKGVNFAVFSRHAGAIMLILYEREGGDSPLR
jgi:glycogen operon protein